MVKNGSIQEEKLKYEIKNYRFIPEKCGNIPPHSFTTDWPEYYKNPWNVSYISKVNPAGKWCTVHCYHSTVHVCCLTVKNELFHFDHFFIRLTKVQMSNAVAELQKLTHYWLIKQLFLCILQTFPFSQPSNPILLCLSHTPLPPSPSPSLCFNWLLSALSFVMEMTRPESKWHYVKIVSCDSCHAKSLLLYSSFRIKLETLSQSPHNFRKTEILNCSHCLLLNFPWESRKLPYLFSELEICQRKLRDYVELLNGNKQMKGNLFSSLPLKRLPLLILEQRIYFYGIASVSCCLYWRLMGRVFFFFFM